MNDQPRMYGSLAPWFHLITAPEEYAEEAGVYRGLLEEAGVPPGGTVLELGSGGGNNASHLKAYFKMTLSDLSQEMLGLSKKINPDLEHVDGDMRSLRLDREFDAVFAHDAIDYMASEEDLRAAMQTAFVHARSGGAALFVPDDLKETYSDRTDHGGNDDGRRATRYLEWSYDPDPDDTTYETHYAYMLRDENGNVSVEQDRHILGLFPRDSWLAWLTEAGFAAEVRVVDLGEDEPSEVFLCRKPG
ncbi:MAG: class I SAM-dependent methyltransferase [Actinomycetota bacterium]